MFTWMGISWGRGDERQYGVGGRTLIVRHTNNSERSRTFMLVNDRYLCRYIINANCLVFKVKQIIENCLNSFLSY